MTSAASRMRFPHFRAMISATPALYIRRGTLKKKRAYISGAHTRSWCWREWKVVYFCFVAAHEHTLCLSVLENDTHRNFISESRCRLRVLLGGLPKGQNKCLINYITENCICWMMMSDQNVKIPTHKLTRCSAGLIARAFLWRRLHRASYFLA